MISVYEQQFTEEDAKAAYDAVKSGVLSSFGSSVRELEEQFTAYVGRPFGMTCCNGTAGLVLALRGLDITRARVAVPACSFAATGFAAIEQGNHLEFIDADPLTWNLDLKDLENKCKIWRDNKDPIKCVIAVHTYGNPYDYTKLRDLALEYNFKIIEDACEAIGAEIGGTKTGNFGDVSVFSFYGNKLIAGGEGGFVLTSDSDVFEKMKLYRGQGQDPNRRFWHIVPGFNYRITNLQASVILSQFKRIKQIQEQKMMLRATYNRWLPSHLTVQQVIPKALHSWWMISVLSDEPSFYERMRDKFAHHGIETRPIFPPLPDMPAFQHEQDHLCKIMGTPTAAALTQCGITLPSGPGTKLSDVEIICDLIRQ